MLSCFKWAVQAGGGGMASYVWEGKLPGGVGVKLPSAFVAHVYSRGMIRECLQKAPRPVDCTRVGASAGQPAITAEVVTVDAPEVGYPQGDSNGCIVCSTASALLYIGATVAAQTTHRLLSQSLDLPHGANRVTFVRHQCWMLLQPEWQSCRLSWSQRMNIHGFHSVSALLAAAAPGSVTVLQLLDSCDFPNHCVAVIDGWIFDPNRPFALPAVGDIALRAALDTSCLGTATFVGVLGGFQLVPPTSTDASRVKRAAEWPTADEGSSKASRMEEALLSCSACCESKPIGMFSANQLRKKAKRRCKECIP